MPLFAVDLTLQLLEVLVLAELSLMVASSAIHPVAHSLTLHLPPLSPSNHRVLPLKREQLVQRPTSLSPLLETAPLLTLTPPTPPPPPGTQPLAHLTHTPLAHHHNLKTHFVARESVEQHTHLGEVELMKCQKEVVPMSLCLGSVVALDLLGTLIRSLVHLLPLLAQHHRQEVVTPAA